MAKKFLSIVLTLSMVASLFAGMTFNVSAISALATENLDGVTVNHYINKDSTPTATHAAEVKALVTAGSQLVNDTTRLDYTQFNFGVATRNESTGAVTESEWEKYNQSTGANILSQMQNMVNSPYGFTDIKDATDKTLMHGRDNGGFYTINANKEKIYRDVENTDDNFIHKAYFEYNIGTGATITDIIIGSASGGYRTGYYTVLTSENGKDWTKQYVYACDRKVDGTNAVNSGIQHIKFATAVKANYVRVEVYAHINSFQLNNAYTDTSIRMKCLQIYGTKANYVYSANGEADINNHGSDGSTYVSGTLVPKYNELLGAQNSLIAGKKSLGVKYFISEEGAKNTAFDKGDGTLDSGFVYGAAMAATPQDSLITDGATGMFLTDTFVVTNSTLKKMFFTNVATSSTDVKGKDLINDESKQWLQIDYALDAQTEISKFALMGKANQAWAPSHYKYYVADTRDGLYDEANCVAEIHRGSRLATVTLDTPVEGKYVGLRIICPYNPKTANGVFTTPSGMYIRLTEFEVFGEYANPITATAANATAEGATTTPTATFSYVGNVDDNSNYGAATVALSTEITVTDAGKVYDFKGWYLGEELISTAPSYIYNVRPSDAATLNFVAKYGVRLYNMTGVNKVGDATPENGFNVEPKNSLLAGAKVQSAYYLNTDLNDAEELRAMQPTKLADDMLPPQIGRFTSVAETASDVVIFNVGNTTTPGPAKALAEAMFVQHDGTKVTALDQPDETKQWVQVNYKLPAEASITDIILSYNKMTSDNLARWIPSSYVYILADSEEDLLNGNGTRLEVNYTADTIKNITKLDLTEATTAKYIGIRFLQLYNDFNPAGGSNVMSGNFTLNLGLYARVTHLDVHGQYLTTATNDITAKAVDAEGAEVAIDATATAAGVGGYDNNGNYVSKKVALAAEETKVIGDYEYTFAGWYKNDEANAVLATATGNVTVADADAVQFTAKYTSKKLITNYTLTFYDATKAVVGTIEVEEGQKVDMALVNAIEVKDVYGYKVQRDEVTGYVVWNKGFDEAVTGDMSYTAQYVAIEELKTTVTVYDVDGSKYIDNREVRFDSQIYLQSTQGAEYWADAKGDVLVGEPTGYLYACGTEMNIYAKKGAFTTPAVAFVGKDHKEANGFTVFAHVNVENATAYGVVFASNSGYVAKNDFEAPDAIANPKRYQKVEIDINSSGAVDFMATLNYAADKPNPDRYARAYVVVNGQYIYSDVIRNK